MKRHNLAYNAWVSVVKQQQARQNLSASYSSVSHHMRMAFVYCLFSVILPWKPLLEP